MLLKVKSYREHEKERPGTVVKTKLICEAGTEPYRLVCIVVWDDGELEAVDAPLLEITEIQLYE